MSEKQGGPARVLPFFKRPEPAGGVPELKFGAEPVVEAKAKQIGGKAFSLQGKPPAIFLIGSGRAGKTTLAKLLAEAAEAAERQVILACMDMGDTTLARYFDGVVKPASEGPVAAAARMVELIEYLVATPTPTIVDLGGGDTALATAAETIPGLTEIMESSGVAPIAMYVLSPRETDLGLMAGLQAKGFKPKATVLVLNAGLVEGGLDREEAFGAVMRNSVFRDAVAAGAVVMWLPKLEQGVAVRIEERGLLWRHAKAGTVPEGSKAAPLGIFDRSKVTTWLGLAETALAPIKPWLP